MKPAALRILFACVAVIVATLAGAQWSPPPPPHFESIDLPAVNGRVIFTGRLTQLPSKDNRWEERRFPISVDQVLKGKAADKVDILARISDEELLKWKSESSRLLVSVPAEGPASIIDLSSVDLAVMTVDLRLLRKPDEVLAELKKRIAETKNGPPVPTFSRSFPNWKLAGTPLTKQFNKYRQNFFLDVPADERLEKLAQKEAVAPDVDSRIEAIGALSLFMSPANVELIRGLLKDEVGWTPFLYTENDRLLTYRTNVVRHTAFQALEKLKVGVLQPVDQDPPAKSAQVIGVELETEPFSVEEFRSLKSYPNLAELYLAGRKLSEEEFTLIGQQKNLRDLYLEGSNIRDKDLARLADMPKLRYIALTNTAVTEAGLRALANVKTLRRVDVGQSVTEKGIAALRHLRPDLVITPDPFAFLAPLKGRRIDQPIGFRADYAIYTTPDSVSTVRRRSFALVVPGPHVDEIEALLQRKLPALGWGMSPADGTWLRKTAAPAGLIKKVDEIDLVPERFTPQPTLDRDLRFGERVILVGYSVDPAH